MKKRAKDDAKKGKHYWHKKTARHRRRDNDDNSHDALDSTIVSILGHERLEEEGEKAKKRELLDL